MKIEVISRKRKTAPYITHYGLAVDIFWDIVSCHIDNKLTAIKRADFYLWGAIEHYYGETPRTVKGPSVGELTILFFNGKEKRYKIPNITQEMVSEKIRKTIFEVEEMID